MEKIIIYAVRSLPSIVICFIGITAFQAGLQRFGMILKIKLWLVFVVLWVLSILTTFLLGEPAFQIYPFIGLPILFIGIFFWSVSLIFALWKRNSKNK